MFRRGKIGATDYLSGSNHVFHGHRHRSPACGTGGTEKTRFTLPVARNGGRLDFRTTEEDRRSWRGAERHHGTRNGICPIAHAWQAFIEAMHPEPAQVEPDDAGLEGTPTGYRHLRI